MRAPRRSLTYLRQVLVSQTQDGNHEVVQVHRTASSSG